MWPLFSICGSNEAAAGQINFKNLATGEQQSFSKDDLEGMVAFIGQLPK